MRQLGDSLYDSVTGAVTDGMEWAFGLPGYEEGAIEQGVDYVTAEAQDALARLASASQHFQLVYAEFSALPAQDDPYWQSIKARADGANATLQSIADAAQSALGWGKRVFGLSGVRRGVMRGLGIAPVLAAAFIAGAIALVVAITNEMTQFILNYRLVQSGKAPLNSPGGVVAGLTSTAKWGIGLAIVMIALPHVMDAVNRRR